MLVFFLSVIELRWPTHPQWMLLYLFRQCDNIKQAFTAGRAAMPQFVAGLIERA